MQIALDPISEALPVGISVRADVVAGESSDALTLPREALEWRGGRSFVRKASGEETEVKTGLADAARIEITSGLAEGDEVALP